MPVRTPFEPEQAVADERSIGTQEIGDEGDDGQPEQRRQAGFIGVQEDADEEQHTGHGIVLKHHLPDAAQQGVDHSDCRVHVRHVSPGARPE